MEHNASVEFHCNRGISDFRYCSAGTIDECSLNDLLMEHPENDTNLLFNCEFTCKVSEKWMLDLICDEWQNNTNCDSSRKEFRMQTTNSLNHIEKDKYLGQDCLLFENKKALMVDQGALNELLESRSGLTFRFVSNFQTLSIR